MELYNEIKNYSHPNITKLISEDITCIFTIILNSNIKNNFKLIDKGENGEIYIILNKNNQIVFYFGKKTKKQLVSPCLEINKHYHIIFVRSFKSLKNYLYINGKIENSSLIVNVDDIDITSNKINFFNGGIEYKMDTVQLYNYSFSLKQVKMAYLYDSKNKAELLKFISNRLDEIMEINTGIYCGFLLEDILILFTKCQTFMVQKNYPLDTYIKYNMEQYEFNIPQVLSLLCLKINDLSDKFNTEDIANNLITWQVGMFENVYSKNIPKSNIYGYWIEREVSPFIPFTGKGLSYVTEEGKIAENKGTFQSGMFVSFIKIIIDQFLITKNNYLLKSIYKTIDYLLEISTNYKNGGVPLYYPILDDENWKYNISIKNGNYINYLRTIELILNSNKLLEYIKINVEPLKHAYKKSLNLLLKLQINIKNNNTIWCQYYDKNSFIPTCGNENEPIGLCSLESAQILLYLMEFEMPTKNIKNAIISGCNWFKKNMIYGWVQIFDKKSYDLSKQDSSIELQTMLIKYNYKPFPNKMVLHSRYYDFDEKPIFQENNKLYTIETFNDTSVEYRNNDYHIGMWGHNLLETYQEWKKLHNI